MEKDYNLVMEQILLLSESCAIQRKDLKKAITILKDTEKQLEELKNMVNKKIGIAQKVYQMKILKKV